MNTYEQAVIEAAEAWNECYARGDDDIDNENDYRLDMIAVRFALHAAVDALHQHTAARVAALADETDGQP